MIRQALFLVFASLFLVSGSACTRQANVDAVEKLRLRLIGNQFEEMYNDSRAVTRARISREEFILKMREIADSLKSVDPEIKWRQNET